MVAESVSFVPLGERDSLGPWYFGILHADSAFGVVVFPCHPSRLVHHSAESHIKFSCGYITNIGGRFGYTNDMTPRRQEAL